MKQSTFFLLIFMLMISSISTGQTYTFTFDGQIRSYDVHLPPGYNESTSYPLVLELHGSSITPALTKEYTRMDHVADTANFIVVYPCGVGLQWNNGYGSSSTADDVGFISALIDTMNRNFSIDTNRIYATGGSAGGFMCYRLACEIPWRFAAIASVAGLMANSVRLNCQNDCAMPILHIHGTSDINVPYAGTPGFVSVDSTMKIWIAKDNCPTSPVVTNIPDTNLTDSSHVIKYYYGTGTNGNEVILYKVIFGSHSYPGGDTIVSISHTNMDMIASVETWNFFKNHTRQCQFTGITENSNTLSIECFPNPATNTITISANTNNATLIVYNMQGQQMKQIQIKESIAEINISSWAKGIYFAKIFTKKGIDVKKFIKE